MQHGSLVGVSIGSSSVFDPSFHIDRVRICDAIASEVVLETEAIDSVRIRPDRRRGDDGGDSGGDVNADGSGEGLIIESEEEGSIDIKSVASVRRGEGTTSGMYLACMVGWVRVGNHVAEFYL